MKIIRLDENKISCIILSGEYSRSYYLSEYSFDCLEVGGAIPSCDLKYECSRLGVLNVFKIRGYGNLIRFHCRSFDRLVRINELSLYEISLIKSCILSNENNKKN